MAENHDVLQCPLCKGHGEVRRVELIERLSDAELKAKIEAYLGDIVQSDEKPELASIAAPSTRNFQKDVHSRNPQLPMWRRSPKE